MKDGTDIINRLTDLLAHPVPVLFSRILVGGIFLFSGLLKIWEPLEFADSVNAFGLLPDFAVSSVALTLPVLECLTGLLLLGGWQLKTATLSYLGMMGVFFTVLLYALVLGLAVDCGCFGGGMFSSAGIQAALWRDVGILVISWPLVLKVFGPGKHGIE